jgi:hypothetical protein
MKNVWKYLIGLSCLMLLVSAGHAATYKYLDRDGRTVYSQYPPASGPYEVIDTPKSKSNKYGNNPPSSSNTSSRPSLQERAGKIDEQNKLNRDIASETEKNKKLREENCKTARKNLEVYQVYRRFKDDKGNVVRMSDQERLKKIEEARDSIKQFCD